MHPLSPHHAVFLGIVVVLVAAASFVGYCWGKSKRGDLVGSPLGLWLGGAFSAFIGGFVEGGPIGGTAGAAMAAADGQVHADFLLLHLVIEAAHVLAIPVGTGLADVRNFIKVNPFPNIFVKPNPGPLLPSTPMPPKPESPSPVVKTDLTAAESAPSNLPAQ